MIGRVFSNRYQLTERIGIGGMAEVYQAQDQVLGRRVAVKVMLPQYAADKEFTDRFRQEAAAAANLQSPFIVNVYDWGQDNGVYYIVMEYVRGSDLKTAIKQRGAINQRKVAEIGAQVCQALSVAHNQDIIHRDIKPQNIMVQPDGNVKVMDFGIARAKNSLSSKTSAVLGTAHYISPEQAQGQELTAASDIYSLGVVMYEAVTGTLPFDGPDSVSVALKQVNDYPIPPSQVNPDIDLDLEDIILQAMEKDPKDRYATASDMKRAINDYLSGRTAAAYEQTHMMAAAYGPDDAYAKQPDYGDYGYNDYAPYGYDPGNTSVLPAKATDQSGKVYPQRSTYAASETVDKKEGRGKKIALGILGGLIALALLALAANLFLNRPGTIPNVTGQTVDQAVATLKSAGFEKGSQEEVFSDTIEAGKVVSTDPAPGTEADPGTKVNLSVSKGKEQVSVPDIKGMTESEAKQRLIDSGFKSAAGTAQNSATVPEGSVISQSPEAGSNVDKGATITYVLSKGPEKGTVPNVVGMDEGAATSSIEAAGFFTQTNYEHSSTVAIGSVISQSPDPGTELDKGNAVNIVVSQGPSSHAVTGLVVDATGAPSDKATVAFNTETVQDGAADSYWINVSSGYEIVSVIDSNGVNYGTDASGAITNVTNDVQLVVTITKSKEPEPTPTPNSNSGGSSSGSGGSSGSDSDSSGSGSTTSNDLSATTTG